MLKVVILLLACSLPRDDGAIKDHFDMIEVNHCHGQKFGQPQFDQLIFWRWSRWSKRYHAHGFKIIKNCRVMDDEEHKKSWEADMAALRKATPLFRLQELSGIRYKGRYEPGLMHPRKNWQRRKYVVSYFENDQRYEITADHFRETNTIGDPERYDRKKYPDVERLGVGEAHARLRDQLRQR